MNRFLKGLLAAALLPVLAAVQQSAGAEAPLVSKPGLSVKAGQTPVDPSDPIEKEYRKLLEMDDAAEDEVDKWIRDAKAFEAKGAGLPTATLNARINQRFAEVRKAYDSFLERHPRHARARLAYGSFLNEIQREDEAVAQWEKARELEPNNPAAWNNLANHYGHRSPVKKAFEYYAKAIELDPNQPVYLQNLATTVYLFRQDAQEYYNLGEEQIFNKALELYRQALKLDPKNFPLATDLAQSFYGIKPLRTKEAMEAWDYALKVANDDLEREGVYLHMARVELNSGLFEEAHRHINIVTNPMYDVLKDRLTRNLKEKEARAGGTTNAVRASAAPLPVLREREAASEKAGERK